MRPCFGHDARSAIGLDQGEGLMGVVASYIVLFWVVVAVLFFTKIGRGF
jgi:hypothetical protein